LEAARGTTGDRMPGRSRLQRCHSVGCNFREPHTHTHTLTHTHIRPPFPSYAHNACSVPPSPPPHTHTHTCCRQVRALAGELLRAHAGHAAMGRAVLPALTGIEQRLGRVLAVGQRRLQQAAAAAAAEQHKREAAGPAGALALAAPVVPPPAV
jgi:hypothetical protein